MDASGASDRWIRGVSPLCTGPRFRRDPHSWPRPGRNPGEGATTPLAAVLGSVCASATSVSRQIQHACAHESGKQARGNRRDDEGASGIDAPHLFGDRGVRAATGRRAGRRPTADDDADASFVADVTAADRHPRREDQNIAGSTPVVPPPAVIVEPADSWASAPVAPSPTTVDTIIRAAAVRRMHALPCCSPPSSTCAVGQRSVFPQSVQHLPSHASSRTSIPERLIAQSAPAARGRSLGRTAHRPAPARGSAGIRSSLTCQDALAPRAFRAWAGPWPARCPIRRRARARFEAPRVPGCRRLAERLGRFRPREDAESPSTDMLVRSSIRRCTHPVA